MGDLIIKN